MVDPVIAKTAVKPLDPAKDQGLANPSKSGGSKFDKVRARLLDEQAQRTSLPPEIKQISQPQKQVLANDLSRKLKTAGTKSPQQLFAVEMKRTKTQVDQLSKRVNALPRTPAFEPFRNRLTSIDAQYRDASQLVNSIKGTDSPGDLMKIQMQMYQLTENVELMSKVVEQLTSGVKTLLQTQV